MSRFTCPTSALSLSDLSGSVAKALLVAISVSLVIHLSLIKVNLYEGKSRGFKPLTTKFIKREPRLIKPLELRKRPRPKPRPMKRQVIRFEAKVEMKEASSAFWMPKVMESLATPRSTFLRRTVFGGITSEPGFSSGPVVSSRLPEERIDMSMEMLDIDALDIGKYHACVIQDPRDKKKIKGFFHLALVYSENFNMRTFHDQHLRGQWAIRRLVDAINKYTDIKTDIIATYTFDSPEILKIPWIMVRAITAFRLTESETGNIGRYLVSGGFMFVDIIPYYGGMPADSSFRLMFREALATQDLRYGKDWVFEVLPNSHPLFHCYFDFDGPPRNLKFGASGGIGVDPLEAIIIDGRVLAILSRIFFTNCWGDWGPGGYHATDLYGNNDPGPHFKFGVNLIVFALTQEGSITYQTMQRVE